MHTRPKPHLLVIDDDDDIARPLARLLESEGYRVRRAADGTEGVRRAVEEPPDLIILDFMMPGKDGFETSEELRRIAPLREVPILALTAFGRSIGEIHGMGGEAAATRIQDFLEKPFEPNVLLARIASLLHDARRPAQATRG